MRFGGLACQNTAYLGAICDLELRFRATTWGRDAIWEITELKRCNFAFALGRPLFGVAQAEFLVSRALVPCQNGSVLMKIAKIRRCLRTDSCTVPSGESPNFRRIPS